MPKKILLTGGGSGGHIYPLLAVIDELNCLAATQQKKIIIQYLGPVNSFSREFESRGVLTSVIVSSKWRRYFSLKNFIDIPKFVFSFFQALFKIARFQPEVVLSKGGPGALSVVLAARFCRIPLFIHESDAVPGFTNSFSSHFAEKIFISFEKTADFFPREKVLLTGNPVRKDFFARTDASGQETAKKFFGFVPQKPVVLVLGGSQGAAGINDFILDNLKILLAATQIIHQTGQIHFEKTKKETDLILRVLGGDNRQKYFLQDYFNELEELKKAFGAADVVVSRAGSGAIFEIAAAAKPAILLPLEKAANNHQQLNAEEYAKTGAAVTLAENNLKSDTFLVQLRRILDSPESKNKMSVAAKNFAKPDAAKIIAAVLLNYGG